MCRIAAYMGAPCLLGDFLRAPGHSLFKQSWAAREMTSATVNADGWGAGWFDANAEPAVYRNILPVWADGNVDALARSLRSRVWLGNMRSATPGLGTDHANTQPFHDRELVYTHNGFIDGFAHTLRATMRAQLDPAIEVDIAGNTDSEYLFALIRQQTGGLAERVRRAVALVRGWLAPYPDTRALLNVIVCDGRRLVATRAAVNACAPSLYINPDWRGATVIASEAFDDDSSWQRLDEQQIIVAAHGQPPQQQPL